MLDYSILDDARRAALRALRTFRADFYLAGGTALALQLGHRDSVDFDFFTEKSFDTNVLYSQVVEAFGIERVVKTQEAPNTLSVLVDRSIRLSFFFYPYPLIEPAVEDEFLRLASVRDIGCMKLAAIVSRSALKDYVDLYFILQRIPLGSLLTSAAQKMPDLDRNLVLKSLVYFGDLKDEPVDFKKGREVSLKEIKKFLITEVPKVARAQE